MNTFATQPHIQQKALQKALQSDKIGKHGKRRVTLLKEEVYKRVQEKILYNATILIEAQMKVALTGNGGEPDYRAIDSLLNRVFGRPMQDINQNIKVETRELFTVDPEKKKKGDEAIDRYLKERSICKICKGKNE